RRTFAVRNPLRRPAAAGAQNDTVSWPGAARPVARWAATATAGCALAGRLRAGSRAGSQCLDVRRGVRALVGNGLLGLLLLLHGLGGRRVRHCLLRPGRHVGMQHDMRLIGMHPSPRVYWTLGWL